MSRYKFKKYSQSWVTWVLIIFAGWSGYRLYQEGAFRGVAPAISRVYGKTPIVGKYIRSWARGGRSYRRSRRYRRGYRKGVSKRRYRRGRRRRR